MKIGKKTILVSPNITKFGCMLAILTGWYMWPKEADYKKYEKSLEMENNK